MDDPLLAQEAVYGKDGGPPMLFTSEASALCTPSARPVKRRRAYPNGTGTKGPFTTSGSNGNNSNGKEKDRAMCVTVEELYAKLKHKRAMMVDGNVELSPCQLPGDFDPNLVHRALAAYALLRTLSIPLRLSPFTPTVFLRALYLPYPNTKLMGQIHVQLLRVLFPNLQMGYSYKQGGGGVGVSKRRTVDNVRYPLRAGDNLTHLDALTWPLFYDDYCHLTADRLWAQWNDEQSYLDFRNMGRLQHHSTGTSGVDGDDDLDDNDDGEFDENDNDDDDDDREGATTGTGAALVRQRMALQKLAVSSNPPSGRRGRGRPRKYNIAMQGKQSERTKTFVPPTSDDVIGISSICENEATKSDLEDYQDDGSCEDVSDDDWKKPKQGSRKRRRVHAATSSTSPGNQMWTSSWPLRTTDPSNESLPGKQPTQPSPAASSPGQSGIVTVEIPTPPNQRMMQMQFQLQMEIQQRQHLMQIQQQQAAILAQRQRGTAPHTPSFNTVYVWTQDAAAKQQQQQQQQQHLYGPMSQIFSAGLGFPSHNQIVGGQSKQRQDVEGQSAQPQQYEESLNAQNAAGTASSNDDSIMRIRGGGGGRGGVGSGRPRRGLPLHSRPRDTGNGIVPPPNNTSMTGARRGEDVVNLAMAGTTITHPTTAVQSNQPQQLLRAMYLLEHQRHLQQMRLTHSNLYDGPMLASPSPSPAIPSNSSGGTTVLHGRPPQHGRVLPTKSNSSSIQHQPQQRQQRIGQDSQLLGHVKPASEEQPFEVPKEVAEQLQDFVRGVKRKVDTLNPVAVDDSLPDNNTGFSSDGEDEDDEFVADLEESRWIHFKPLECFRSKIPYHRLSVEYKLNILEFLIDELLTVDAISSELSRRQAATELYGTSLYGVLPTEQELENLENDDECQICRQEGDLLCCDGCLSSYHHQCLHMDPAIALPEGRWLCPECKVPDPSNFGPLRGGKKSSLDWFAIDDLVAATAAANDKSHPSEQVETETSSMVSTDVREASSKKEKDCSLDPSDNEQPMTAVGEVAETAERREVEYLVIHGYVFCRPRSDSPKSGNNSDSKLSTPFKTMTKSQLDACLTELGIRLANSWPLAQIPSTAPSSSSGHFPSVEHYLCRATVDPESYENKYRTAPISNMMYAGVANNIGKLMSLGYEQECHPLFTDRIGEIMIPDLSLDSDIALCLKLRPALFDPYLPIRNYMIRLENTVRKACLMHEYWESGEFNSRGEIWTMSVRKSKSIRHLARLLLRLVNRIHPRAFWDVWFQNPHGRTSESGPSTAERSYMTLPGDWSENKEKTRRRWQSTPSSLILSVCQPRDLTAFASEIRSDIFIAKPLSNVRSKRKTHRTENQNSRTIVDRYVSPALAGDMILPPDGMKILEADTCYNVGRVSSTSSDQAVVPGSIPSQTHWQSPILAAQQSVCSKNAMPIHLVVKQENGSSGDTPGATTHKMGEQVVSGDISHPYLLNISGTIDSVSRLNTPSTVDTMGTSHESVLAEVTAVTDSMLTAIIARFGQDIECETLPHLASSLNRYSNQFDKQQGKVDGDELDPATETSTTSDLKSYPAGDASSRANPILFQQEKKCDDGKKNAHHTSTNDIETTTTEICPISPRDSGEDLECEDRLTGGKNVFPDATSVHKVSAIEESSPGHPTKSKKRKKSKKLEVTPSSNRRTRRSGRLSIVTSSTTDSLCEAPEQPPLVTPPTPEVLDGMQLQIENAKKSHIRGLEKLLKGQYLGEGIWPIAGRRVFPTSGDIAPNEMKRLARNAGTVKSADLVYDTKHEVAQVCYGHIWRKLVGRCSEFEELLLMIRILESSVDRTMIHSCENSAKRGKSTIQKVIRCTIQNPATGYIEHFIVNRKSMKGCWIPALQLDLSSLMMELSNRRHVQTKNRQERVRLKEKAEKEKTELIKAQRAAQAAKLAEEIRQRKAAEAELARQRKIIEAEEARQRKAREAEEVRQRKAAEAAATKAAKLKKKQEEKERTAILLAMQKQKTQAEKGRLNNQIHIALTKHGEAMFHILKKCLSGQVFTGIPEADVIAIRKNTLDKIKESMNGLMRLNVPKMDDQQLMALIFSREKVAAASLQKTEQISTHVNSEENGQRHNAVSFKDDMNQPKVVSGAIEIQVGNPAQNQPKYTLSMDPLAEKNSFLAPRAAIRPTVQVLGYTSAAPDSRSQQTPLANGSGTVHSGELPGPFLSSLTNFQQKQQLVGEQSNSSQPFHIQSAAQGNSDEDGTVSSMRGIGVFSNESWRKDQTEIQRRESHIAVDHSSSSHLKSVPEKDIASTSRARFFGSSPIVARAKPHNSEAKHDIHSMDHGRQNGQVQIGSGTHMKPQGTDPSSAGGAPSSFEMDFEPKPLPDFSTRLPGTAGGLPNANNLAGFPSRQEHSKHPLHASHHDLSFRHRQQLQQYPSLMHHQQFRLGHDNRALLTGQPEMQPEVSFPFNVRNAHHNVPVNQFGRNSTLISQLSQNGSNLIRSTQLQEREQPSLSVYPTERQPHYAEEQTQIRPERHQQPQKQSFFGHAQPQQEQQSELHQEMYRNQAQRYVTSQQVPGAQPYVDQKIMQQQLQSYMQLPLQRPIYPSQGQDYAQLQQFSTTHRTERFDAQVQAGHGGNQQLQDLQLRQEQIQRLQQQYGSPPPFPP